MLKTRYYQQGALNRVLERDPGPLGPWRRPGIHGYATVTEEAIQRAADELAAYYAAKRARTPKRRRANRHA